MMKFCNSDVQVTKSGILYLSQRITSIAVDVYILRQEIDTNNAISEAIEEIENTVRPISIRVLNFQLEK